MFRDYTEDVFPGSVRMRGRDGAFSQFLVTLDATNNYTLIPLVFVALDKLLALQLRIVAAALNDVLNLDLLGLVADITLDLTLLLPDLGAAIEALDQLIAIVTAHAGIDISNIWDSAHTVPNDAGEILGLAQSLRFTLVRMQSAPIL
jgi:hypothetical protein